MRAEPAEREGPRLARRSGAPFGALGALALVVLVLATVGATAWLGHQTARREEARARAAGVQAAVGQMLSALPDLISRGELLLPRRMMVEAAGGDLIQECALILPDGAVIAHSDPARITAQDLPAAWPAPGPRPARAEGEVHRMAVPGRGEALLVVRPEPMEPFDWRDPSLRETGFAALAAVVGAILISAGVRRRARGLVLIREALATQSSGSASFEELRLDERLGREAEAWNQLVRSREEFKQQALTRQLEDSSTASRREGSRDLDSACEVMRQGILLVDRGLGITYANGAAGVYLRAAGASLMGTPAAECIPFRPVIERLQQVASGGLRTWTMVEARQAEGEAEGVLRFSMRPVRGSEGAVALLVIDDVTQHRVAEESRNSFVNQVVHELRAPLTNIRLYVEAAIEAAPADRKTREQSLNVINQETRRLSRVVDDMLSVAEMEAGQYEVKWSDVPLGDLFDTVRLDYGPYAEDKKITLTFDLPPKLPLLRGDRDKIALALHNLLNNAIKYTPAGGRVEVRASSDDRSLTIEVADNGIGIRPEEQERIFEKFYRARDSRVACVAGSGLGLALAREVVRLHGGDLTVDSQMDVGSTFTVTLPLMARAKAA